VIATYFGDALDVAEKVSRRRYFPISNFFPVWWKCCRRAII